MRLSASQPQLSAYLNTLASPEKDQLEANVKQFDFARLAQDFKSALETRLPQTEDIQPIDSSRCVDREKLSPVELDKYFHIGLKAASEGKIGALVLAGGQGSRLGSPDPKGIIPLGTGLDSRADSLLFIQAAQIAHFQRMARERFPGTEPLITWLVMTSHSTDAKIRAHLEDVLNETGLKWDQVIVFTQSEIPAFDFDGNVLFSGPTQVITSPGGNGGIYEAIRPFLPILDDRGVKVINVYGVDNILCPVPDLHMIGYAIDKQADCVAKVMEKKDPGQSVGHFCLENGRVRVLEYSEISRELAEKRDPAAPEKLWLRAGNILNHVFTLPFLREVCSNAANLPYHIARKRISHFDLKTGKLTDPIEPNGIKLERFIFDAFCYSKNFLLWQVDPHKEFSPLKNADSAGRDCLSTCLDAFHGPNGKWIRDACVQCCLKFKNMADQQQ